MNVDVLAIGYGSIARPQLRYLDALDSVSVVAGADVSADARTQFDADFDAPTYAEYESLLAAHGDADLATVMTPHALHHEQILACFAAGLDVYVEKPLVVDLDEAVDIVSTARRDDRVLQVGYQRHFHPLFERVRELVTGGRIGRPHFVACYLEQDWIGPQSGTWRTDPSISGGGHLIDSGSHLLDALLWCTGADPTRVAAVMDSESGVDVNSALAVTLDRQGTDLTATVGVTADGPTYPETSEELVVVGTDGKVRYTAGTVELVEQGTRQDELDRTVTTEDVDESAVFVAKLDDVISAVRGEHAPAVPGEVALGITALTEAAYEAAETATTVDVGSRLERARASVAGQADADDGQL